MHRHEDGSKCTDRAGKIDIYNHVIPPSYMELVKRNYKDAGLVKRLTSIRNLWDMDARVELLEPWPEMQQVLTLAPPSPEALGGPEESPGIARVANDGMAEIREKNSKRFPAFVAALPMNNVPAALKEMDRAIRSDGRRLDARLPLAVARSSSECPGMSK